MNYVTSQNVVASNCPLLVKLELLSIGFTEMKTCLQVYLLVIEPSTKFNVHEKNQTYKI